MGGWWSEFCGVSGVSDGIVRVVMGVFGVSNEGSMELVMG